VSRAHTERNNWAYLDNDDSDEEDDDYDDYDSDYQERYNNPHAPSSYNGCTRAHFSRATTRVCRACGALHGVVVADG
jgi:hypothetical protein